MKPKESKANARFEESRRSFLKNAGKIAVYTPPAMLVISQPSYANVNKSGGQQYSYPGSQQYSYPLLQMQEPDCIRRTGPITKGILARFCRIP